ncbi:hypothetical protein [Streptomyces sp. NBC_00439]|uniref:hypothetical protein n=1 Tax=Streptomyces sp. NBC_00439 TaxID=2903650 RepID=UPI00224DD2EA|nr:hypothetical protein [Streptomyces sp. NBC_00439]MCX5103681.1 hypothetical protein [Streptomyces sp. NBC_00439]
MLSWAEGALFGAGGGLVVEAVVTFGRLHAWQQARHAARVAAEALPRLGAYIDLPADSLAALFRVVLGGAAGWLLHGELAGVFAAVAVGASAPAVLAQMGSATTVADALQAGTAPGTAPAAPTTPAPSIAPAQPGPPGFDPARGEAAP